MGNSSRIKFIKTTTNEAPYQMIGKRTLAATLGHRELYCGRFWLSLLSECLGCYLYVFIVCSTRISWTGAIIGHEPNLLAMSLSSGIAMMLLILTFRTVHVNPALTISFLLTGRIPIIRALLYVLVHCLGSIAAIAFLYSISIRGHNGALGLDNPHEILSSWQILIVEAVISFVVTLATYATCNYSSYGSARKFVLEQLGASTTSSLFEPSPVVACDNPTNQRVHHSRSSVAPIVPQVPTTSISILEQPATFRPNLQACKGSLLSSYNLEDNNQYDYEYDNHRIYATQQKQQKQQQHQQRLKIPELESPSNQVPIEEVMQDECRLLAPNGFSLHMTSGQALVIGLAYTLTSLSGIPASGASLNPARSFGPAFIMNHWDRHWIYWLGPILGAIVAGFCYEFIFNPTRKSSLCYRPKLFRFSAHDMAKVGSKSRLYQQQQQQLQQQQQQQQQQHQKLFSSTVAQQPPAASTIYRPQIHNQPIIHHSPSTRASASNLITNSSLSKSSRDHQLNATSTSVAQLQQQQPPYPMGSAFDQMNFLQQQQQQQVDHQQIANFDRNISSAIINSLTTKPHQSNFSQRNNADQGFKPLDQEQVVYDDPKLEDAHGQFRIDQVMATNRRPFARPISNGFQQRQFDCGPPNQLHPANLQQGHNQQYMNDCAAGQLTRPKPFNTVKHLALTRPHSFASIDHKGFHNQRQSYLNERHHMNGNTTTTNQQIKALQALKDEDNEDELMDEDLYHVLSESHGGQQTSPSKLDRDTSFNMSATNDSSQRTSDIMAQSGSSSGSAGCSADSAEKSGQIPRQNGTQMILNARDYDDTYYN